MTKRINKMDIEPPPIGEIIQKIFQPEGKLLYSDLARLSALEGDWLTLFKNKWQNLEARRRITLITAMVTLGGEDNTLDFTSIFTHAIDDPEEELRIKAIEGLGLEDRYTYVLPILKALKTDDSVEVRAAATRALGKFALLAELEELPDIVAQEIFVTLLEVLQNDREPNLIRGRALESIAPFHQELVGRYIEDFYHSEDPGIKTSALYAMGRNCDTRWLSILIDEMQSSVAEFRYEAAQASGEIADEEAVPFLIPLLQDKDAQVQEAAIQSLGKIGGQQAKKALQGLAHAKDARVREAARDALAELLTCEDPLSLNL